MKPIMASTTPIRTLNVIGTLERELKHLINPVPIKMDDKAITQPLRVKV